MNFFLKVTRKFTSIIRRFFFWLYAKLFVYEFIESKLKWVTIEIAIDIVIGDQIDGDYFEFGVYKGDSFSFVFNRMKKAEDLNFFKNRRFFAFDSFEGLPQSGEKYLPTQYSEGSYSSSLESFYRNIKKKKVDLNQVITVRGFYDKSLTDELREKHSIKKLALAYFDTDLYESTIEALHFITPYVQKGTILVFDDWFRHRSSKSEGVQKACNEWLESNPKIELNLVHLHRRVAYIVDC